MNLYQELLIDHYKNSPHRGTILDAHFSTQMYNPSCGDAVSFQGLVKENIIKELKFMGSGCVISQATASLLIEHMLGKNVSGVVTLDKDFILTMIGMELGPLRIKCALLPLEALQEGINAYQNHVRNKEC